MRIGYPLSRQQRQIVKRQVRKLGRGWVHIRRHYWRYFGAASLVAVGFLSYQIFAVFHPSHKPVAPTHPGNASSSPDDWRATSAVSTSSNPGGGSVATTSAPVETSPVVTQPNPPQTTSAPSTDQPTQPKADTRPPKRHKKHDP